MEADWEFEIGGNAPVIDAAWPGFVDLRIAPDRVDEVSEIHELPPLRDALARLNAPHSTVWTAKCDVWQPEEFDADELDAKPGEAAQALACYIDLLPRTPQQWSMPAKIQQSCEAWHAKLRTVPLPNCRADFVIRRAWLTPAHQDLGITAYLTACGSDLASARAALSAALGALTDAIRWIESGSPQASHYNEENPGE